MRAAADDDTADDAQTITHTMASGSASEYVGLSVDSVAVTVTDDDEPEVTVSRDTLSLVEGSSGSYTVRLAFQPSTRVTVDVTGGGDVTVTPTSLTFSTTNWATARTVTVRAAEDNDTVDDSQTVTHAVDSGSAPEYAGLSIDSVAVTVTDNDAPGVSVSRSTLRVNEGGSGTYTVRLASQPTAGVTINVAGGGGVTVVPTSLTFSTSTWNTPQTVTVRAAEDADTADDAQTVTHTVDSNSAPEYAGLSVRSVAVTVTDNDDPEVTVSFAQESYTVSEGSSVTVRVRLSTAPRRTVDIPLTTVNLGGASAADYSGVPSSVRFQGGAVVRSFTFSAVLDNVDDVGESVRIGFGTLPALVTAGAANEATVSIANLDPVVPNRAPTASATAEPNTVYPGDLVTLDGTASDPDGDALTFRWTSDGGGDFFTGAGLLDAAWIAPATETAHTVNLTLTVTDPHGLIASVTVSVIVEPLPQPNPATDVRAVVSDDNSVVFTWTIPGQPRDVTIDNVQVQQRDNRGAFEVPTWDTVVTLAGAGTHTTVNGLADDTEYVFRIRLTTTHGLFADSRYIRVRTLTGAPSPRHFAASGPTQTSITLDWFTVETAAEYKLEYRKDGETEWNRISGDFDHLPSTMDHRQAFGVAAGLDCNTRYDFRVSARGSGETRNDGRRYPSTLFGSYATASARTGECAQEERVTNLLVSVEPSCATLTWTPPSGDRDTGYRVERYSHTGRAVGELQRTPLETLVEEPNRVANRYEDCSAEYRTDGAEHFYSVTALDNNPGPDEEGAFGTAYTSMLRYGTSREPEGPLNVRLTHDTQSSRGLAWDAPRDPWLTTVKTARAGSGPQQVVTDPWTTGYRVERREYRRTEGGGWFLPEYEDEAIWSATMTVGSSSSGTPATGYFGLSSNAFGAMTQPTFTHPVGSGSWEVTGLFVLAGELRLIIQEGAPLTDNLHTDAFEDWVLVVDGRSFPFELPEGVVGGNLQVSWPNHGLNWIDGQQVSLALVERLDWEALRDETDGDTGTSFTDSEDKGDKQYVYRVWAYNPRGLSLYSWRGDWVFNGGDPGGDPEPAVYIPPSPGLQQGGETPSNTPATGAPAIGGTPQVGETLTAGTAGIADEDGLTKVSYTYQWTAGGSDIGEATGSSYLLTAGEQGQTIQVKVTFTDDADNQESLTSAETLEVAAKPNTAAAGEPTISGTPQVDETLTAGTSAISDEDGLDNVSYQYQWLRDDADIAGQTNSTYRLVSADEGKTIKVRVTFTDDAGNAESLTSTATTPIAAQPAETPVVLLTASFANVPADHNGENFTFQLSFSENVDAGYARIRDHAFTVTGATIDSASRITQGSNQGWNIEVNPIGNEAVTITLPETTDCNAARAICTDDERMLSHPTSATVAGPPAISVSDATVQEAEGAVLVFTATLSHASSRAVTVDYATSDVTAVAGSDYTAASGALTFNAGDTSQTVQVTVLTDSENEGQETLTLTLSNPSQATLDDATGTGTIENGDSSSSTVVNSPANGLPTVSGTPQVGETLTADTSAIADEDGLTNVSYSYQWIRSEDGNADTDIEDATDSTYTLTGGDVGKTIQVKVTFTDDADNQESLTSEATVAVAAKPNSEPTGLPTISGTPQVDETLTADTSAIADEDGLTNVSYSYQWIAGGSDIAGATGSSYTLTSSEQGQTVQVRVTFTDDADNAESLTSEATVAVAPEPLTVRLKVAAPTSHDGSSEFTFEIEFSEEFGLSYATLKPHAFNVTGGSVERAQRTDKPSNIPWRITVKPHGTGDVTIELPATTDCGATGAICTGDGRKLSNSLNFTVSGPGQ